MTRSAVPDEVLRLPFRPPYDSAAAIKLLVAHAAPGLDRVDGAETGDPAVSFLLERADHAWPVTLRWRPDHVEATVEGDDSRAVPRDDLTARLRRMLDLDADPEQIATALSRSDRVAALVAERPGLRVTGAPDGYRMAVLTVIGQQVSLAAARTFGGRLVAAFGTPGPAGLRRFPTADALAAVPAAEIQQAVGLTAARARTVVTMAQACAEGLDLGVDTDPVATRAALLALPGIGPWTADYLAVRALGDRDAFPAGDLVLRRALGVRTAAEADRAVEACRPFRAYALFQLWHSSAW